MWLSVLLVLGGGYLLVAGLLFLLQGRMLFQATREMVGDPAERGWRFDDVTLDVNGHATRAWYVHADANPRGTILFSHGNAGNMSCRLDSISIFRGMGLDVLVYDYGGYGESTGTPSERRCYDDIRAAWSYLIDDRGLPQDRVILFGRSLGAGPACQLATEVRAAAVILESAFISIPAMARDLFRFFPMRFLIRYRFDNGMKIAGLLSPLLSVHSPDDTLIPFRHGQYLFEKASSPKTFLTIQGEHNEGFWMSGKLYTDGLEAFLGPLLSDEVTRRAF